MLGVAITSADVQDRDGFIPLLKEVRRVFVFLQRLIADGGYSGPKTAAEAKRAGKVELEIVKRSDAAKGFIVLPETVDRRAHIRLARPLSSPRQGFRKSHPYSTCFRATRNDPPHDAPNCKPLNMMQNPPDGL